MAMADEEKNSKNISDKAESGEDYDAKDDNVIIINERGIEIGPSGRRYPITHRRIVVNESPKAEKPKRS
jgi:hypothetical protein